MVQMGDAPSVDRAIFYLNGLDFFNTKMNVKYEVIQYLYLINDFSFIYYSVLFAVIPNRPFWRTCRCRTTCRTGRLPSRVSSTARTIASSTLTWPRKIDSNRLAKSSTSTTLRPASPRRTCAKFSKRTERLSPPISGSCRTRVRFHNISLLVRFY